MLVTRLLEGYVVTRSWLTNRFDTWLEETTLAWVSLGVVELDESGNVDGTIGSSGHVTGDLYSDEGSDADTSDCGSEALRVRGNS